MKNSSKLKKVFQDHGSWLGTVIILWLAASVAVFGMVMHFLITGRLYWFLAAMVSEAIFSGLVIGVVVLCGWDFLASTLAGKKDKKKSKLFN